MRHETEHIAASITDAGDVISRAIRICIVRDLTTLVAVAEDDSFFTPESFERYIVANVIALSVSNWQAQNRTLFQFISKRSVCSLYPHADMFANEMQRLRINAPGRSPASHKIWNPLQMPRTSLPESANFLTEFITGENLARAPARR
jgi:hypothetical protein